MAKTHYECRYCGNTWTEGFTYSLKDPECRKCGSKGEYYLRATKEAERSDQFGYNVKEYKYGEE